MNLYGEGVWLAATHGVQHCHVLRDVEGHLQDVIPSFQHRLGPHGLDLEMNRHLGVRVRVTEVGVGVRATVVGCIVCWDARAAWLGLGDGGQSKGYAGRGEGEV